MSFKKLLAGAGLCLMGLTIALSVNSCTPMITEEQLAKLRELRQKEASLNDEINSRKGEIPKLQAEINARQALVDDCNGRMQFIKDKLSQWPNVWPDGPQSK